MKKREKTSKSDDKNIIVYDTDSFLQLMEIAKRNGTNASSIISNFIDSFVAEFNDRPQTLDSFVDENYVPMPKITEPFENIIKWLKTQDTRVLEELDSKFHMAHVYARVLSRMPVEQRKTLTNDYPLVWRTFYR